MSLLQRRPRVRLIGLGARHLQRLLPVHLSGPAFDVDDVEQPAFRIGEKDRAHAVGQTEQAFDRRRGFGIRGGLSAGSGVSGRHGSVDVPSSTTPVEIGRFS
jgi:hypothetical protein